eukprot:CAMPEP_0176464250 /NCGR_PEP_ID=MMETSP0127-20121128/36408_1 /TAXON_ID=938130 /ORGANISM="Platyophrya macrostoma, Strain WH" /LENGTH=684 /DNA_ID=CAMNT_0017856637 /DNA_START=206 /DNA_END=2260 /DNA_ORIENTATION=-
MPRTSILQFLPRLRVETKKSYPRALSDPGLQRNTLPSFCHSETESAFHPSHYKTRDCDLKPCPYEKNPSLCPNTHAKEASRIFIAKFYDKFASKQSFNPQGPKGRSLMNLNSFKTNPCTKKSNHEKKTCPYYHNEMDKRRPTTQYNYCFEMCNSVNKNHNPCDNNCPFAKNKVEQLYHPEKYKKKFCSFAHNENEIRTDLFYKEKQDDNFNMYKLKTVFCPFKNEHDRSTCPYAHNVQDYRRNPTIYKYEPEECANWSKSDSMTSYDQPGCVKLLDCDKCHGWKEYEYHPAIYKTRTCSNNGKCQKKDCSYHHNKDQKSVTKGISPNGDKQIKNFMGQMGNIQSNLFKQENSFEPREKRATSNFMRPLLANYIPSGSMSQDSQKIQLQQEQIEFSSVTYNNLNHYQQECTVQRSQGYFANSMPSSLTNHFQGSLLQESYSTHHNSAHSSGKESSEDENCHEGHSHKAISMKKTGVLSPQSDTSQKNKNRKPLKLSKKNQNFTPSGHKEGFEESLSFNNYRCDQNAKGNESAGSIDLQKKFQSRSNTPDSMKSGSYDKRSINSDALQNPGFIQPRFHSYGANTFSSINFGFPILYGQNSEEKKTRIGETFQGIFTSPFDLDELRPHTNKSNLRSVFQSEDNDPISSAKFMEDNAQNDEEDLKTLLNEIDQYAEANNVSFGSDDRA